MPGGWPKIEPKIIRRFTKEYVNNETATCIGLARKYGLPTSTVWKALKRQGIEIRKQGVGWSTKPIPSTIRECNGGKEDHRSKHRDTLLTKQDNACAICHTWITKRTAHVDHCHTTNKIREALCSDCNLGLGRFFDNPVLLRRAANYVTKHARKHKRKRPR